VLRCRVSSNLFDLGSILLVFELWVVGILVDFKSQKLGVFGLRQPECYLARKLVTASVLYESLLLLIKDGHVDVLIAELGELHRLLYETSLPFAVCHVTSVLVLNFCYRRKFLFAHR
jgi:hypothetical protein